MAEEIKFTFLGTGSSIPTARRNHQAFSLRYKAEHFLFDCGEGTQRQFRKARLNPCKITKIFISHWHADHSLGLPGLLMTLATNGYNGKIEIHGPRGSRKNVDYIMDHYLRAPLKMANESGTGFEIDVFEHGGGTIIDNDDFKLDAMELDHGTPTLGFAFIVKEKKRLDKEKLAKLKLGSSPLIGKLAEGKTVTINGKKIDGKKLIYVEPEKKVVIISDTGYMAELGKFSKGADLLVIESSFAKDELATAKQYKHLTSELAAKVGRAAKVRVLALVHLSQRYEGIPKVLAKEAAAVYKGSIIVPEDLDRATV
ncbi:MAG: ribonuclease Z [Patescibacteria group bacterium]|jgi:ribonuclease Z